MKKSEYIKNIGDSIVREFSSNSPLWQYFTVTEVMDTVPFNPLTGQQYMGINAINLMAQQSNFHSNHWVTYDQAQNVGAQVRAGEKATIIEYWKNREFVDMVDENGNQEIDENGNPKKISIKLDNPKQTFVAVFNIDQIDGLPDFHNMEPTNWYRNIENILADSRYKIVKDEALPLREYNGDEYYYYGALLPAIIEKAYVETYDITPSPQGSFQDAKDKLIRNLALLGLCREYGLAFSPIHNSILEKAWLEMAAKNPIEFFKSAAAAAAIDQQIKYIANNKAVEKSNITDLSISNQRIYIDNKNMSRNNILALTKDDKAVLIDSSKLEPIASDRGSDEEFPDQTTWEWSINTYEDKYVYKVWYLFGDRDYYHIYNNAKELKENAYSDFSSRYNVKSLQETIKYVNKQIESISKQGVVVKKNEQTTDNVSYSRTYTNYNFLKEFKVAAENLGLLIDGDPIDDGKLHRVPTTEDAWREKSGAYVLYSDGRPAGFIQNFRGEKVNWKASADFQPISPEQKAAYAAEMLNKKHLKDMQRQTQHERVATKASSEYKLAKEVTTHPYLEKKGVKSYGLKQDNRGNLIMPLFDIDGKQWSLERINIDFKGFEKDSKLQGNFYPIGHIKSDDTIIIAEGYATAATLHEATNLPSVVAASANNLITVAKAFREKYPDSVLIVAGDNDYAKQQQRKEAGILNADNKGVEEAKKAAYAVKGSYAYPFLNKTEIANGMSDFNDLAKSRGISEVKKQIGVTLDRAKSFQSKAQDRQITNERGQGIDR